MQTLRRLLYRFLDVPVPKSRESRRANFTDLPPELLHVIAKIAVKGEIKLHEPQASKEDLVLRLISKSTSAYFTQALVHKITWLYRLKAEKLKAEKLIHFLRATKMGPFVSVLYLNISKDEFPTVHRHVGTLLEIATRLEALEVHTTGSTCSLAWASLLSVPRYPSLKRISLSGHAVLPIVNIVYIRAPLLQELELLDYDAQCLEHDAQHGAHTTKGPIEEGHLQPPIRQASGDLRQVDYLCLYLTFANAALAFLGRTAIAPVHLRLYMMAETYVFNEVMELVPALQNVLGERWRSIVLETAPWHQWTNYKIYDKMIEKVFYFCEEKGLSMGTAARGSSAAWMLRDGKRTQCGTDFIEYVPPE